MITLTKVPPSLRGDLTKWYQEVQTGVYVGNVSARIRDLVWERVMKNIGSGEATMVYNAKNELGYQIKTTRKAYEVVDFDGIPLMMRLNHPPAVAKHGFSNAAKYHRAKVMARKNMKKTDVGRTTGIKVEATIVSLDLETTGLDATKNQIIAIGAVKRQKNGEDVSFHKLIRIDGAVPKKISELTGITSERLSSEGVELASALQELGAFVKDAVIVGYNLRFDEAFLSYNIQKNGLPELTNQMIDLMPVVKKANQFLENYRLATVLKDYDIENLTPHHALADAKATLLLAMKLMKNGSFHI